MYFADRRDAGKKLAQALAKYKNQDVVILALPRGGVVVAEEIANALQAPLNLMITHKIGHPYQPEYAIAAVSERGHIVINPREVNFIDQEWFEREKERQILEIKRKRKSYLKGKQDLPLKGKIAILVDDGIATGLTMEVAVLELKDLHPEKIVIAVPVSPKKTADQFRSKVDDFICLHVPEEGEFLGAIGAYYRDFSQVEDEEVLEILDKK